MLFPFIFEAFQGQEVLQIQGLFKAFKDRTNPVNTTTALPTTVNISVYKLFHRQGMSTKGAQGP